MKTRCHPIGLIALLIASATPTVAWAQASRTGPTFAIGGTTSPVRYPDVAYDSSRDRYLVVSGNGFIEGQLLNAQGAKLAAFPISTPALNAQGPRVVYSPDLGGYLVTWHEWMGTFAQVRAKLVSGDGALLSGDIPIDNGSNAEYGLAVGYATGSHEFLVAYSTTGQIRISRINLAGALLQAPLAISSGGYQRDPSITYNPHMNEFYVAYAGWTDYGFVRGQRIQAGSGAVIGGAGEFHQASGGTTIPHVEYNLATQQYVLAWWAGVGGGQAIYGVSVRGYDGAQMSGVRLVSSYYLAYDALDLAYNAGTGNFLLVTHGAGSQDYEDAAVLINADGSPYDNGFILTNTPDVRPVTSGDGNFNPRVVASASAGRFLAVTSSRFLSVHGQFATSGGGTPPPPPPPPTTSNPMVAIDMPASGAEIEGWFPIVGWAADLAAQTGTGVPFVDVWAHPTSGAAPTFLGTAPVNGSRPDVAAYYGRSQFTQAGFLLWASLPGGTYDIRAYAWCTLTGDFNRTNVGSARITVRGPVSWPAMAVDLPAQQQVVATQFAIAGWAVDFAAPAGQGTSTIYVWAAPLAGGNPIFAGSTTTGAYRPDVAAAFGDARWGYGGFVLTGSLPRGDYDLVVYALSTVTGTYNNYRVIRIRVV